jgi:hypothetical protein
VATIAAMLIVSIKTKKNKCFSVKFHIIYYEVGSIAAITVDGGLNCWMQIVCNFFFMH